MKNETNNAVTRWQEFSHCASASAAHAHEGGFAETNARQFAQQARAAMAECRSTMAEAEFWEAAATMGASEAGRFFAAWRTTR